MSIESTPSEPTSQSPSGINVGMTEREVSLVAGAAAALIALQKPLSLRGIVMGGLAYGLIRRGMTGHCGLYEALGTSSRKSIDDSTATPSEYNERSIHVAETVTIMKSPDELYAFWRKLENLPQFMEHVEEVTRIDDTRSHWKTRGPMSFALEWDAEIINDEPGSLIAWKSVGEAEVDNAGSVRFLPIADGEGTEIHVTLDYIPPGGTIGHYVAKLLGEDPSAQCKNDLRRLKQLLETGELATNAGGRPRGV